MKNRTYMLPHSYQRIGWMLLILLPIVSAVGFLVFYLRLIPQFYSRFLTMISFVMLFTGLFMIILSKEKEEDEMIVSIRRSSVSLTAWITFVLYIAASSVIALIEGFRSLRFAEIYRFHTMVSSIMTPLLIYFVIFRMSVWRMRRECKEDRS